MMRTATAEQIVKDIKTSAPPYEVKVGALRITVCKHVYPPADETTWLIKYLQRHEARKFIDARVLDYGTGSGSLGIWAAKAGAHVVALDANRLAVACAKANAERNGVGRRMDCRISNGTAAIEPNEMFELVLANLPFDDAKPRSLLEMAVFDFRFRMRRDLRDLLRNQQAHCTTFLTYSARAQRLYPLEDFFRGLSCKLVARRMIYNEQYLLYQLSNWGEGNGHPVVTRAGSTHPSRGFAIGRNAKSARRKKPF
jgi:SAM-dependent methyltransferase